MLEVHCLVKTFDDFSLNVSFSVNDGETLVIAGPSGCGKTTLLNLLLGLIPQDSGDIWVSGVNISALPPWSRNMSIVFQDLALFPHLNIGANVEYGLKIRNIAKKERQRIAEKMLNLVNLSRYQKRRIDTLSGGEKQRVALARALAVSPDVLLLDEPFSGLDAPLRRELAAALLRIREQSSAPWILVTHHRNDAELLGHRVALLDKGRLIESGAVDTMLNHPQTAFAAQFFSR